MAVDLSQIRPFLEDGPPASILDRMDYQLWQADESISAELARETYGWLVAVHDIEPNRDLSKLVLYVDRDLRELAAAVPDSYFSRLDDGETHSFYRISAADGFSVDLHFDMSHGENVGVQTHHDRIDFSVPTLQAYIEHSVTYTERS